MPLFELKRGKNKISAYFYITLWNIYVYFLLFFLASYRILLLIAFSPWWFLFYVALKLCCFIVNILSFSCVGGFVLYFLGFFVSIILVLSLLLLFVGLPGIWLILIITGIWAFFIQSPSLFSLGFFLPLVFLAVVGEVAEFFAGYYGTKRFGGSSKGGWGGIVGGFVGAILGAAFLFGFGAIPGAFAGAFAGCFFVEKVLNAVSTEQAVNAAWGTTLGRLGGMMVKLGLGIWILYTVIPAIMTSAGTSGGQLAVL